MIQHRRQEKDEDEEQMHRKLPLALGNSKTRLHLQQDYQTNS
jgi:hypothetical protein